MEVKEEDTEELAWPIQQVVCWLGKEGREIEKRIEKNMK
jgi:hypothetical protein